MGYLRRPSLYILLTASTVYLLLMLPSYGETLFAYDSFYNVWRARKVLEDPFLIFRPNYVGRFAPLHPLFLFLMDRFFGFSPFAYGIINASLHLLNAFLLFLLVYRLWGSRETPAILASIFFLFSSTQWGVLWETGQTMRLACVFLSLLSLLCFLRFMSRGRKIDWVWSFFFFVSSFGWNEDMVSLPLLLLAILFLFPAKRIPWLKKLILTGPFFLVSLGYTGLSFSVKGPQGWALTIGPHVLVNQLFLIRELVQFLLIPRPEFVPFSGAAGILFRVIPFFLIALFAGFLWHTVIARRREASTKQSLDRDCFGAGMRRLAMTFLLGLLRPFWIRFLIFGIAWIAFTSLLYALRPMQGAWQGRYLYIPAMGEAMVVGMILYLVARYLKALDPGIPLGIRRLLSWGFLGIVSYGLVLNILTTQFMIHKARSGLNAASREEIPVIFPITNAIRDRTGSFFEIPPDMILVVEGLPLSMERLKELLMTYYTSLPRAIIEAKEGRPLTDLPLSEKEHILYMKWENQKLRVVSGLP